MLIYYSLIFNSVPKDNSFLWLLGSTGNQVSEHGLQKPRKTRLNFYAITLSTKLALENTKPHV